MDSDMESTQERPEDAEHLSRYAGCQVKRMDEDGDEVGDWSGVTSSANFQSEAVTAGGIEVAGTIIKQLNLTTGSGIAEPVQLSVQHFRRWTLEELDLCETELIFEAAGIQELRCSLEEKRFLVLSGDPESGKGTTALLLGAQLVKTLRMNGVLACQGLDTTIQVDLERIANSRSFGKHVAVLEDALAGENSDVSAFLKTLDFVRLATLGERLRKNNAAIVLTVASHTISDHERRLENLGVLRRVAPPSHDVMLKGLRHFTDRLPLNVVQAESVAAILPELQETLAQELKTIPRLARFVHEYLTEVAEGKLNLRQALSRMDDLSEWLTIDLAGDLDAQAAVLAICLGSAVPPLSGVPWFSFDHLRRKVLDLLRKELRLAEDAPLSSVGLGRAAFLERARAHVVTMPSPLPDLVRFRDDRYAQRLWQSLLGPAREFATLLLPLLQELSCDPDPLLRSSAASALGRLGQIGTTHIVAPILYQWVHETPMPENLGYLLQGVMASQDKAYGDFCLGALRRFALDDDANVAEAAVHSLRLLGRPDPEVPIRELCVIARSRLPIQTERLRLLEREIAAADSEARRCTDPRRVSRELRVLHAKSHTFMIAALVPEERIRLLGAIQYSLAGILFSHGGDPAPVLHAVTSQMKAEPAKLAPLFAYLFLHRKGLIDLLDRHKWISGSFGMEPCSRFLLAASRGPDEAALLREFLERSFQALQIFPGLFRFLLEQRFLNVLRSWSQEGCRVILLRATVVRLLSDLLASENADLRKAVDHFLRTDSHFTARGSRPRALALDSLSGREFNSIPATSPRPQRLPAWLTKVDKGNG